MGAYSLLLLLTVVSKALGGEQTGDGSACTRWVQLVQAEHLPLQGQACWLAWRPCSCAWPLLGPLLMPQLPLRACPLLLGNQRLVVLLQAIQRNDMDR